MHGFSSKYLARETKGCIYESLKYSINKACSILVYVNEYSHLQTRKTEDNPFLLDFRRIGLRKFDVLKKDNPKI
ncbi:MAG: hypothetical protein NT022_11365, partial [Deltaproteobacteria bacterium]|nr:hypothetical protein [Deltaproteobacteria bacterium]